MNVAVSVRSQLVAAFGAVFVSVFVAACGGGSAYPSITDPGVSGDGTDPGPIPTGTLRVSMTDAPACGFSQVNVTVNAVRVHESAAAVDDAAGWSEIALPAPRKINLLDLQNGVLTDLGQAEVPAITYSQIRLVLASNDGSSELANSVVIDGDVTGTQVALATPPEQQAGLTVKSDFTVAAAQDTRVVLDFDACTSVINAGNSGSYILRPRLSLVPVAPAGKYEIAGELGPQGAGATVSAQVQGPGAKPILVKSTVADAQGLFVLSPLSVSDTGTYSVLIAAPDRALHLVTGVPVTAGTLTSLPDVSLGDAQGPPSVLVSGLVIAPADAQANVSIRALQSIGGVTVQVGYAPVDAIYGLYSMQVPAQSPRVAAHSNVDLLFADAGNPAALNYTLEAVVSGSEQLNQVAPLNIGGPSGTQPMVVDFDLTS